MASSAGKSNSIEIDLRHESISELHDSEKIFVEDLDLVIRVRTTPTGQTTMMMHLSGFFSRFLLIFFTSCVFCCCVVSRQTYLHPLRKMQVLPRTTLSALFANFEKLAEVNRKLLYELEERVVTKKRLGDIFMELVGGRNEIDGCVLLIACSGGRLEERVHALLFWLPENAADRC